MELYRAYRRERERERERETETETERDRDRDRDRETCDIPYTLQGIAAIRTCWIT